MTSEDTTSPAREEVGKRASKPTEIPKKGWGAIFKRVKSQIKIDHVGIVAAGVAFFFFLALFPAIAAAISVYGLVVEPQQAEEQLEQLSSFLPQEVHGMISEYAKTVAGKSGQALGWGVVLSILLSIWSANKGSKALVEGLNIAYDEEDGRNFFKKLGVTLGITLVGLLVGLVLMGLVAVWPAISGALPLPDVATTAIDWARWLFIAAIIMAVLAFVYKVGPHRDSPEWRWVSAGSVFATVLWLAGSLLFSLYVTSFGNFGETYGSLAAVVILMLWFFLSAFVILIGAEINSESEHQTRKDTTVGEDDPMGKRGAFHADHVAGEHSEKEYQAD